MNKLLLIVALALLASSVTAARLRSKSGTDLGPEMNSTLTNSSLLQFSTGDDDGSDGQKAPGFNIDDYDHEYCEEGYGMFEGQPYEYLHEFIEDDKEDHMHDENCWSYDSGEDRYTYELSGCVYDEEGYTYGYAFDASNYLYYYKNDDEDVYHAEMYDCEGDLVQTWGVTNDVAEYNTKYDNDAMKMVKDLYNLGFHYYIEEGYTFFSDPSGSGFHGEIGEEGYGAVFSSDSCRYLVVQFGCFGATGYSFEFLFDDSCELVTGGDDDWQHDCSDYKSTTGQDGDYDFGNFPRLQTNSRLQSKHGRLQSKGD